MTQNNVQSIVLDYSAEGENQLDSLTDDTTDVNSETKEKKSPVWQYFKPEKRKDGTLTGRKICTVDGCNHPFAKKTSTSPLAFAMISFLDGM